MLTVVWSPVAGQAGTTTVFCALSYCLSKKCKQDENVLMFRTKLKNSHIAEVTAASSFGLNYSDIRPKSGFSFDEIIEDKNVDRLLMSYAAGLQLRGVIKENAIKLAPSLFAIEGSRSRHREIYEDEMKKTVPAIFKAAESEYSQVIVEAESGFSTLNHTLFELADRIVVCLPQNNFAFHIFNQKTLPENKMYAVFGQYDPNSVLNARNLGKMLPFGKRYTVFPYLTSLKNAYSAGKLIKEFEELSSSEEGFEFEKALEELLEK